MEEKINLNSRIIKHDVCAVAVSGNRRFEATPYERQRAIFQPLSAGFVDFLFSFFGHGKVLPLIHRPYVFRFPNPHRDPIRVNDDLSVCLISIWTKEKSLIATASALNAAGEFTTTISFYCLKFNFLNKGSFVAFSFLFTLKAW